jgi:3-deoxy-7-phosphoheptulonate synthase
MQNYSLLERLGTIDKPVLLKRGLSATIKEWLMAAEYIVSKGNHRVALCERGIRTFETMTRNTLDINAVPVLKALTHLPVVVDPSHGIGLRAHVPAIARAGIAAGADGLIIEVHPHPEKALSDGHQSLTPAEFAELMRQARVIAGAIGRPMPA